MTPLESAKFIERYCKSCGLQVPRADAKILRIARGEQEEWVRKTANMGKVFIPAAFGGYLDTAR